MDVKHTYTMPYYPRCSSLVESFNGTCQKILFKLVDAHPRDWDEYLDKALWACKLAEKRSIGFSPYHLVYSKEAMVPLEVMLPSLQFY